MLCSLAEDTSGDVYKIISISWDGSCKELYLRKQANGRDQEPRVEKDIFEREICPVSIPPPRQLTPPPERQWSPGPAPVEPSFNQGPPIQVFRDDGGIPPPPPIQIMHRDNAAGPPHFDGGYDGDGDDYPGPKSPYVEDWHDNRDDDYSDKPPLSPDMAQRGIFPADEGYYASGSQSYDSHSDDYDNEPDNFERRDEGYGGSDPGFVSLRSPARHSREKDKSTSKPKKGHGEKHRKKHHRNSSERSERSSEKSEKSDNERDSRKSKSKRSRRSSSSSDKEEKKEKKESSHSHRGRQKRKPSLFGF